MYSLHKSSTHLEQVTLPERVLHQANHMNKCSYGGGGERAFTFCRPLFRAAGTWLSLLVILSAIGCNDRNAARGFNRTLESQSAQAPSTHLLLEATPSRIDMGEVAPAGRKQATFTLTNAGTRTIELARIETSCDCLSVEMPSRVAPAEQIVCRAKLDLREEPDFTGDMAIEIRGRTSAGEQAFFVTADVRVPSGSKR